MNLAEIIEQHPAGRTALVSRGRTTTYGDLRGQVAAMRGGLRRVGVAPGDRVAILCANNWYFVVSYLAILGAGAVAVPLNPRSPSPELTRQLVAVDAKAAIVGPAGRRTMAGVDRSAVPTLETVVMAEEEGSVEGAIVLDDVLAGSPKPIVDRAPDDLAVLLFTSGTAGPPRAAMLTHANLLSNLEQVQAHPGRAQGPKDVSLGVLPLSHIFGLNVVLGLSLFAGSTVVLIERFDPASALEAVGRHGVTIVGGAPQMWADWADLPDADPSLMRTVRLAVSGASRLPDEVADRFKQKYGIALSEGYGLTEASPVVTTSAGDTRRGSIGVPLPGVQLRLVEVDERGRAARGLR